MALRIVQELLAVRKEGERTLCGGRGCVINIPSRYFMNVLFVTCNYFNQLILDVWRIHVCSAATTMLISSMNPQNDINMWRTAYARTILACCRQHETCAVLRRVSHSWTYD